MSLLSVKDLSISFRLYDKGFSYKDVHALKDVNIKVNKGELLTIVGASGAGKSLLAHAIFGLLPDNAKTSGTILFEGKDLSGKRLQKARGRYIRFIPQSVQFLDPSMKVGKQLRLGKPGKNKRQVLELLERFDLDKKVYNQYPHELSGGMLRRVLLATCFSPEVKLVVADEPTPGIHPKVLEDIYNAFSTLRDSGVSVILITHGMVSAMNISDRITVFHEGSTVASFAPIELTKPNSNIDEYVKRLWRAQPENDFWEALA